jgi:hypothetical protein
MTKNRKKIHSFLLHFAVKWVHQPKEKNLGPSGRKGRIRKNEKEGWGTQVFAAKLRSISAAASGAHLRFHLSSAADGWHSHRIQRLQHVSGTG